MTKLQPTLALSTALMLAACGGSDGEIASAPPPVPLQVVQSTYNVGAPLPPTPALTSVTYDVFGISATTANGQTTSRQLDPAELHIAVEASTRTYTVQFDPAVFPGRTAAGAPFGQLAYIIPNELYGHEFSGVVTAPNGTTQTVVERQEHGFAERRQATGDPQNSSFGSYTGRTYVSLGLWDTISGGAVTSVAFAYGERTPPAALPVSGTATYRSTDILDSRDEYLGAVPHTGVVSADIKLVADFGTSAIDADVSTYFDDLPEGVFRQNLTGSDTIDGQGAFEIALTGTATMHSTTLPVTGTLGGAFFGPNASQVGGYLFLPAGSYPTQPVAEAIGFVAARDGP